MNDTQNQKWEEYLRSSSGAAFKHSLGPREIFRDIYEGLTSISDVATLMGWTEEDTKRHYEQWKPK